MAVDLYDHSRVAGGQYFFLVRSLTVDGCQIVADHSAPARNPSLRLKQYGVFRPLDALADATLGGSPEARTALDAMGRQPSPPGYQPILLETPPAPVSPESAYIFKWSGPANPRRGYEAW
jgi:hypothetical protein